MNDDLWLIDILREFCTASNEDDNLDAIIRLAHYAGIENVYSTEEILKAIED